MPKNDSPHATSNQFDDNSVTVEAPKIFATPLEMSMCRDFTSHSLNRRIQRVFSKPSQPAQPPAPKQEIPAVPQRSSAPRYRNYGLKKGGLDALAKKFQSTLNGSVPYDYANFLFGDTERIYDVPVTILKEAVKERKSKRTVTEPKANTAKQNVKASTVVKNLATRSKQPTKITKKLSKRRKQSGTKLGFKNTANDGEDDEKLYIEDGSHSSSKDVTISNHSDLRENDDEATDQAPRRDGGPPSDDSSDDSSSDHNNDSEKDSDTSSDVPKPTAAELKAELIKRINDATLCGVKVDRKLESCHTRAYKDALYDEFERCDVVLPPRHSKFLTRNYMVGLKESRHIFICEDQFRAARPLRFKIPSTVIYGLIEHRLMETTKTIGFSILNMPKRYFMIALLHYVYPDFIGFDNKVDDLDTPKREELLKQLSEALLSNIGAEGQQIYDALMAVITQQQTKEFEVELIERVITAMNDYETFTKSTHRSISSLQNVASKLGMQDLLGLRERLEVILQTLVSKSFEEVMQNEIAAHSEETQFRVVQQRKYMLEVETKRFYTDFPNSKLVTTTTCADGSVKLTIPNVKVGVKKSRKNSKSTAPAVNSLNDLPELFMNKDNDNLTAQNVFSVNTRSKTAPPPSFNDAATFQGAVNVNTGQAFEYIIANVAPTYTVHTFTESIVVPGFIDTGVLNSMPVGSSITFLSTNTAIHVYLQKLSISTISYTMVVQSNTKISMNMPSSEQRPGGKASATVWIDMLELDENCEDTKKYIDSVCNWRSNQENARNFMDVENDKANPHSVHSDNIDMQNRMHRDNQHYQTEAQHLQTTANYSIQQADVHATDMKAFEQTFQHSNLQTDNAFSVPTLPPTVTSDALITQSCAAPIYETDNLTQGNNALLPDAFSVPVNTNVPTVEINAEMHHSNTASNPDAQNDNAMIEEVVNTDMAVLDTRANPENCNNTVEQQPNSTCLNAADDNIQDPLPKQVIKSQSLSNSEHRHKSRVNTKKEVGKNQAIHKSAKKGKVVEQRSTKRRKAADKLERTPVDSKIIEDASGKKIKNVEKRAKLRKARRDNDNKEPAKRKRK